MNGKTLSEQLIQARPELKILFMSGYADDAVVRHGVLEPDVLFLQKPFSATTLSRQVRAALDQLETVSPVNSQ